MKPLSERSKEMMARYRAAESMPPEVRRRAQAGLRSRIAAGAPAAHGVDVPPPQPPPGGFFGQLFSGPLGKVGIGVALALPAGILLSRGSSDAPQTVGEQVRVSHTEAPDPEPPSNPSRAPATPPVPLDQLPLDDARSDPLSPRHGSVAASPSPDEAAPLTPTQRVAPRGSAPPEDIVLEEEPSPTTIDEEVALLSRAHSALRAGRAQEALSTLSLHAQKFPNSALAADRTALRILALCAAGQKDSARRDAERFLEAHPESAYSTRLKKACVD